jgi:hypothetical protein
MEESIDLREEFRTIHVENIVTMKRMMADPYVDLILPMKTIQEEIERNLTEIPSNTRRIIEEGKERLDELKTLNTLQIVQNEEEKSKLDNITKLSTLSLLQGNEMGSEIKLDLEEVKGTIKETHQKVIEYGIIQNESKEKDMQKRKKEQKRKRKKEKHQSYFKDINQKDHHQRAVHRPQVQMMKKEQKKIELKKP